MNHSKLIAIALLVGSSTMYAAVDPVSNWNSIAVQATLTAGETAVPQSRTLAIVHVAIHDALNSINSRYERYAFKGDAQTGASVDAAIAASARDALVGAIAVGPLPFPRQFGTPAHQALAVAQVIQHMPRRWPGYPDGPAKSRRHRHRTSRRRCDCRAPKHRSRHHAGALHTRYPARRLAADAEPGSVRSAGGCRQPACRASRLGTRHPVRVAAKHPVRAEWAAAAVRKAIRT